jgi:hypothetical protein
MAYVPNNNDVFTAAFAGALAGMGVSGKNPTDTNSADYASLTDVVGAFAQAFDTTWGANPANGLDLPSIQEACEGYWQQRSPLDVPPFNNASAYLGACAALVAIIQAGDTYYAGQGITPPSNPFRPGGGATVGLIVPDLATLGTTSTTAYQSGTQARVAQFKYTAWTLDKTDIQVPNGNTVVPALGGGNWLRNQTDVTAYLKPSKWYFNALTGSDSNPDSDPLLPLQSFAEFFRRIGTGNLLKGEVSNALGAPLNLFQINLLSDMPPTDEFSPNCRILSNALFAVLGNATPTATGGTNTGAFTAVTPQNRTTNDQWTVTDATITWANHVGKQLMITGGPNVGNIVTIEADLGAGVAAVSTPLNPALPANANAPNPLFPPDLLAQNTVTPGILSVGDPYVIVDLTEMYVGPQIIESSMEGNTATLAGPSKVGFANVYIRHNGNAIPSFPTSPANSRIEPNYKNCRFEKFLGSSSYQRSIFSACSCDTVFNVVNSTCFWNGGVIRGTLANRNAAQFLGDYDCAVRGNVVTFGGGLNPALMRVSNSPISGITVGAPPFNTGNPAMLTSQAVSAGVNALWGKNNAVRGINYLSNTNGKYQTLPNMTITGALGDFMFGSAGALGASFDPATGLISPQNIPTTWANMAIAAPAGFGGHAHSFKTNSHFVAT